MFIAWPAETYLWIWTIEWQWWISTLIVLMTNFDKQFFTCLLAASAIYGIKLWNPAFDVETWHFLMQHWLFPREMSAYKTVDYCCAIICNSKKHLVICYRMMNFFLCNDDIEKCLMCEWNLPTTRIFIQLCSNTAKEQ